MLLCCGRVLLLICCGSVVALLGRCRGFWDGGDVADFLQLVLLLIFVVDVILNWAVGFVADLLR